jgi:predicted RNA-binding Zn-ribbon protein involved in translation (DUF1610 family)
MLSYEDLYYETNHWIIYDRLGYDFALNILIQDELIKPDEYQYYLKKLKKLYNKIKCPKCGSYLVIRRSKYSRFYGCSKYPNCKFIISEQKLHKKIYEL